MKHIVNYKIDNHYLYLEGAVNQVTVPLLVKKINWQQAQEWIIDFSKVSHIDTAGVAWIINVIAELKQQKQQLILQAVPQQFKNIAEISDLLDLLPIK